MRGALAAVAAAAAALSVSAADSSTHGAPWAGLTCEGLLRGGLLPEAYRCAAAKASAGGEGASHDGYVAALARVAAGEQAMHCVHRFAFEEGTGQDTDVSEAMRRCHGLVELADGARTEGELRWAADLGHWPARAELARLVASMGRWDEARGLLRHVVLEGAAHLDEEAHAKALLMLGVAETAIGDVDTAIQTLEEATRAYPSSRAAPRAHKLLTGIYGTRGDRSSMSRHAVFAAAMNHEFFAAAAPDGNAGASSAEPHALEPDLIGVPTPNPRVADGGAAVRRGGRTGDDERLNRAVFREPVAPLLQGLALMREGPRQRVAELLRAHVGGDSRDQGAAAEPAATAEAASERQFASFRALAARGDAFSGCSDAQIGVDDTVAVWARVTRDDWETRGAVLVDAGANVGDFAVAAGRAFGLAEGGEEGWRGPAAADRLSSTCGSPQQPPTVVCVEANPATAQLLSARVAAMGEAAAAAITVVTAAVWSESGSAAAVHAGEYGDLGAGNELATLADRGERVASGVPLVTVAQLAHTHGLGTIDVLKVDVQGAEPQAIAGAGPLLAEGKVRLLVVEHAEHWKWVDRQAPPLRAVVAQLAQWGYASFLISRKNLIRIDGAWWRDEYALHWSNVAAARAGAAGTCRLLRAYNMDVDVPCAA